MAYFTSGDAELWFETHGAGSPVLLLPGLGMGIAEWGPLPTVLAEHHQVLLLEPRGAGRSEGPPGDYTIELLADDAAALLAHLDIPRCAVLGVSMGGHLALSLALRHPQRVERLVLAFTCDHTPPTGRARLRLGARRGGEAPGSTSSPSVCGCSTSASALSPASPNNGSTRCWAPELARSIPAGTGRSPRASRGTRPPA